jgi:MFS family permease
VEQSSDGGALGRWWLLWVLFYFYAYTFVDRLIVSILVPDMKATLGFSDTAMGLVLGPVPTIVFALWSFPAGWLSDRFPRRLVLLSGVLLFAIGTIGLGHSNSLLEVILARAVAAIGEATILPPSYSLIADAFPRKRVATAIAIFSMGAKVGAATALGVGGLALAGATAMVARGDGHGYHAWQWVFLFIGGPILLTALLTFTFREPGRRGVVASQASRGDLAAFVGKEKKLLLLMALGFSSVCMTAFAMNSWVPAYLTRHFGLSPVQYGPVLGAIGLAASAALAIKGVLMDWFYSRGIKDIYLRLYTWLMVCTLPVFVPMFFVTQGGLFIAMYGFAQIVTVPFVAYATTAIQVITPGNMRARLTSAALVTFAIAGGIGTFVVGFITDHLFRDEAKLGYSLAILLGFTIPTGFICLRLALKPLRQAVIEAENRELRTRSRPPGC